MDGRSDPEVFGDRLLQWGSEHYREFPWRSPERSFYEVFIAEFFLTQTPAGNAAAVYPTFIDQFPTLDVIAGADTEDIEAAIEPLGFQQMRTEALERIADEYERLPKEREELLGLPRVGPYVADATLCFACERPRPILDRNVVRTYNRVFGDDFPDYESARRKFAERLLPEEGETARRYNLALLDFAALVCQKRSPRCAKCFASDYCAYYLSEPDQD